MQRQTQDLLNLAIGNVKDLYFDGEASTIRGIVLETGSRLSCRLVLVIRQHEVDCFDCDR